MTSRHDGCHYGLSENAVGSIKKLIVSKAGQQIICAADACDKITIWLLSGLHISHKSRDRSWSISHHLECVLCGQLANVDGRISNSCIRAMRPAGRRRSE